MKIQSLLLILATALVGVSCGSSASTRDSAAVASQTLSEWPMYGHDPAHTNTNLDETAIQPPIVNNLTPAWQVNIGFNGSYGSNSTPVVAGGHVYVGSSVPDGNNFFAFDAMTGRAIWGANLGHSSGLPCSTMERVGIPSTAAISGNTLVLGGGDSAYYGVDAATGTVLWRDAMNDGPSGFAWSSPVIAAGVAYFGLSSQCDNPPVRGEIRAVHLTDGTLIADRFIALPGSRGGGVWNSPALTPDAHTLVVATGEDDGDNYLYEQAFVTLDPATLQLLQADKEGPINSDLDFGTSPVIFHDRTGRLMGVSGFKTGTFYAYYLDSVSRGPAWTRAVGVTIGATPAYDSSLGPSGTLFVIGVQPGSHQMVSVIQALDPETGDDVWATPVAIAGPLANNVAVAGRLIFANAGEGGLKILDEATGAHLRTLVPANAGRTASGVAVAGGTIYWVSGSWLNAWRLPTP